MNPISNTLFIGKELVHLVTVDSTNTYLKDRIAKNGKPGEGLVIVADEQFAGRGQAGNTWDVIAGKNLTASILFYPVFLEARQIFYFNKAVSLAVRECIASIIHEDSAKTNDVKIKWPNDILAGSKKISGILIENSFRTSGIENTVVGIGINVNQIFERNSFPAISLMEICKKEIRVEYVLEILCSLLEKYYLILKSSYFAKIDELYQKNLFGYGEERKFIFKEKIFLATVKGVDHNGELILETDGKQEKYKFKEVGWILNE